MDEFIHGTVSQPDTRQPTSPWRINFQRLNTNACYYHSVGDGSKTCHGINFPHPLPLVGKTQSSFTGPGGGVVRHQPSSCAFNGTVFPQLILFAECKQRTPTIIDSLNFHLLWKRSTLSFASAPPKRKQSDIKLFISNASEPYFRIRSATDIPTYRVSVEAMTLVYSPTSFRNSVSIVTPAEEGSSETVGKNIIKN